MNVNVWGSNLWIPLHSITFNAPLVISLKEEIKYKAFFSMIGELLPCKHCRLSYCYFIKKLKISRFSKDRMGLTYWLYCIHNLVNLKLKKKCPSFREVVMKYEMLRVDKQASDIDLFVINTEKKYKTYATLKMNKIIHTLNSVGWDFSKV